MDGLRNPQVPFVAPKAPKLNRPKAPKTPAITKPTAFHPAAPKPLTPTDQAMSAFRTALAQVNAATPPVDSAAIYAPYRASEAVTGQLGTGYQQAMQNAGTAANSQYTQGLNDAQQAAAAFGISAGAGANPTQLNNSGTAPIAAQTQAGAASAAAATAQWQALLERTAGVKVADATVAREQGLTTARQSLATALPGLIGDEKNRAFQAKTERFNEGLAKTQLSDKQQAAMRDYNLNVTKSNNSLANDQATTGIKQDALDQKKASDAAKLRVSKDRLALDRRKANATANGLKGVAAAAKALAATTSKAGTKKVAKGFDVQVQPWDTANNKPNGPAATKHLPRLDRTLPGYKVLKNTATTHYETVGTSAGSAGLTASTWDAQMRSLLAQNPGRAAEVKAFLGPRPKK